VHPNVAECRQTSEQLSTLCGSPSDISVQKYMTDLETAVTDIEEGLDDRQLDLNLMLNTAQQCTTCLGVCMQLGRVTMTTESGINSCA